MLLLACSAKVRTLDGNSTFSLQSNLGKSVNKGRSGAVFGESVPEKNEAVSVIL